MTLAVIGGSGLASFAEDVPAPDTAFGQASAEPAARRFGDLDALVLARHGAHHRLPPHRVNYRANIELLRSRGVTAIVATFAVGAIRTDLRVGDLVIPDQIIDYTSGRDGTFYDAFEPETGPVHIDFTSPFDSTLRTRLLSATREVSDRVFDGGVYACTNGPRLETAAEVERLGRDGCTLVGMTAMPEAALAREAGIAYAGIALVVNPAAGSDGGDSVDESALWEALGGASERYAEVVARLDLAGF